MPDPDGRPDKNDADRNRSDASLEDEKVLGRRYYAEVWPDVAYAASEDCQNESPRLALDCWACNNYRSSLILEAFIPSTY